MFKGLRSLLAFLTTIPVDTSAHSIEEAAKYMYLSPLIGAFIGLLAGVIEWVLLQLMPPLVAGALTLGFILLITGVHHTDGLLDFGDGIMAKGSPERKIKVMHDQQTGAGGFALGLVVLLTTFLCIAQLKSGIIIQALITAETSAKLAMVVQAWAGRSAHKGLNTYFIEGMRGKFRWVKLVTALFISLCIATLLLSLAGIFAILTGIFTALFILCIANRHFDGVTGDVMGATNDIARMSALLTILGVI